MGNDDSITIRLPATQLAQVRALAKARNQSVSEFIRDVCGATLTMQTNCTAIKETVAYAIEFYRGLASGCVPGNEAQTIWKSMVVECVAAKRCLDNGGFDGQWPIVAEEFAKLFDRIILDLSSRGFDMKARETTMLRDSLRKASAHNVPNQLIL